MPWQLALSLSILAGIVASLIQRSYSQKSKVPNTFPPAISYLFGVMPVGLIAGFFVFPHHVHWSWWLIVLLVIEAIAMAVANWVGFMAVKRLPVAAYQTINRFYAVVVVVLGWSLLGEKLTAYQATGAIILLIAAVLAVRAPLRGANAGQKKSHTSAVILALVAATALGVALVTEKTLLNHMTIGGVYIVGWSAQTIAMVFLAATDVTKKNIHSFSLVDFKFSALMGLAGGLTGVFYVYAINSSDNVSLVTSLTAISLPLTAAGAYIFLHERDNHKLLWASLALSFVGLIVSALH